MCVSVALIVALSGVYSPEEFDARNTVMYETYSNKVAIEANTLLGMSRQAILPAALKSQIVMDQASAAVGNKANGGLNKAIGVLSAHIGSAYDQSEELSTRIRELNGIDVTAQKARHAVDRVLPAMAALRESLDEIEGRIDNYPYPSYQHMLFRKH